MESISRLEKVTALVGHRLESISRGDFLIDGEPDTEDLGPLELVFDSGATLQIHLVSDGESVEFQLSPTQPFELLGRAGPYPRIDLSRSESYAQLLGQELTAVDAIFFGTHANSQHDAYPESLAGLSFHFKSGLSLSYYNAGDFAKIYVNELPPDLPEPFYLRIDRQSPQGWLERLRRWRLTTV